MGIGSAIGFGWECRSAVFWPYVFAVITCGRCSRIEQNDVTRFRVYVGSLPNFGQGLVRGIEGVRGGDKACKLRPESITGQTFVQRIVIIATVVAILVSTVQITFLRCVGNGRGIRKEDA